MRIGALAAFLAWIAGTPSLLPAAVAALGSLDGQHEVSFAHANGNVSVVFHHDRGTPSSRHSHSPLAQILTAFAQSGGQTQDHVLAFAETEGARSSAAVSQRALMFVDLPPWADYGVLPPFPQSLAASSLSPRPPPICAFALVCLRSTTLRV
ncbi:MAG: hypothetical protein ABIP20_17565 [Chthoniobacteraceae bacterium]